MQDTCVKTERVQMTHWKIHFM